MLGISPGSRSAATGISALRSVDLNEIISGSATLKYSGLPSVRTAAFNMFLSVVKLVIIRAPFSVVKVATAPRSREVICASMNDSAASPARLIVPGPEFARSKNKRKLRVAAGGRALLFAVSSTFMSSTSKYSTGTLFPSSKSSNCSFVSPRTALPSLPTTVTGTSTTVTCTVSATRCASTPVVARTIATTAIHVLAFMVSP